MKPVFRSRPVALCLLAGLLSASVSAAVSAPAMAGDAINLYSYRQPFLMKPLLDSFSKKTGIKVNMVYAKKGMLERLKAEGINTPADVVLASDIGRLNDMVLAGVLAPVKSATLEKIVPASFRHPDGLWYALTTRARIIYASKKRTRAGEVMTYEDLAKPELRGRICIRSGKNVYNISLLSSVIAHKGREAAEKWLAGVKANLARRPQGNDRAQARAIYEGVCDYGVVNTYYWGKMATNDKKPEQKKWASAVRLIFPNQAGRGTHMNISGAAIVKHSKRKTLAIKLVEFLASSDAQKIYAEHNFEYPVKADVALHPIVSGWGKFKADTIRLSDVAKQRGEASRMMDRVRFNK